MSEKTISLREASEIVLRMANNFGSSAALSKLRQMEVGGEVPEFWKGMEDALNHSSENENQRMILMARSMTQSGFFLPLEAFFGLGFPKREFLVYADFTSGRVGDFLAQLLRLLHAQKELGLVLCVKSRLSLSKRILLNISNSFDTDLPGIELCSSIDEYLKTIIKDVNFNRKILQKAPRDLFSKLPTKSKYKNLKLFECLVIHVRGGDALFDGAFSLPSLSYYIKAIQLESPKKVILISEPDDPLKFGGAINPTPEKIKEYCIKQKIEFEHISSNDFMFDAGVMFWSEALVCSTSSFSRMLSLYSRDCKTIYMPNRYEISEEWIKDSSIKYIEAWDGFNYALWKKDLNYRISWVSSENLAK